MSIISTSANYGGKINDNQQGIKQFVIGANAIAEWIYKKTNGLTVQTPSNSKIPVLINGDLIVTGSLYNTSDQRLKTNINNIDTNKIDDLFTLNPIIFKFKNDKNDKIHYGFLAQDIEKKFPELVEENLSGYKTVNYQELIPIMFAKIQQMESEIKDLKK